MPYASSVAQLCAALLTFDGSETVVADDEKAFGVAVAPPHLLDRTNLSLRLQELLSLLARWLPQRLLLQLSSSPDYQQLFQVIWFDFFPIISVFRTLSWKGLCSSGFCLNMAVC